MTTLGNKEESTQQYAVELDGQGVVTVYANNRNHAASIARTAGYIVLSIKVIK